MTEEVVGVEPDMGGGVDQHCKGRVTMARGYQRPPHPISRPQGAARRARSRTK